MIHTSAPAQVVIRPFALSQMAVYFMLTGVYRMCCPANQLIVWWKHTVTRYRLPNIWHPVDICFVAIVGWASNWILVTPACVPSWRCLVKVMDPVCPWHTCYASFPASVTCCRNKCLCNIWPTYTSLIKTFKKKILRENWAMSDTLKATKCQWDANVFCWKWTACIPTV